MLLCDRPHRIDRNLPLLAQLAEDTLAQRLVGHQFGIARGDGDIALGQHHVHVRQDGPKEWPVLVHRLQDRHAIARPRPDPSLDGATEPVPARQHQAALGPAEHPRDCTQVFDAPLTRPRRRPAADVETGDLLNNRRFAEIAIESFGLVDQ